MTVTEDNLYGISLKNISLITLAVQNSFLILIMRYSRTLDGPKYITSTAVFISEIIKLLVCTFIYIRQGNPSFERIFGVKSESWKLAIPAILYTIQNNLQYVAVSRLDAATFQVTYQLKILTTALFSVLLLGKRLNLSQWASLVLLTIGIALVQVQSVSNGSSKDEDKTASDTIFGIVAVLSACILSGMAGVYFEKILKKKSAGLETYPPPSIWERNIQLAFYSSILALFGVYSTSGSEIKQHGFFIGYSAVVLVVIFTQALGGLLVAMVVKYADNILKGFATSISIIISCLVSVLIFDFSISLSFATGCLLVLYSTYMYESCSAQQQQSSHQPLVKTIRI